MNNVEALPRPTAAAQQVLDECKANSPTVVVVFMLSENGVMVRYSDIPSVTFLVGALERMKLEVLNGL